MTRFAGDAVRAVDVFGLGDAGGVFGLGGVGADNEGLGLLGVGSLGGVLALGDADDDDVLDVLGVVGLGGVFGVGGALGVLVLALVFGVCRSLRHWSRAVLQSGGMLLLVAWTLFASSAGPRMIPQRGPSCHSGSRPHGPDVLFVRTMDTLTLAVFFSLFSLLLLVFLCFSIPLLRNETQDF